MKRIYLDHATTTPLAAEVLQAMLPYLGARFGVPSSPLERGRAARRAIDEARHAVASLVHADDEEILFTGSATEANNLALKGVALAGGRSRGCVVAAVTEHISILHPLRTLSKWGYRVNLVPVDGTGLIHPARLRRAISADTVLVSIAHASAEIGTVQPLRELCLVAHRAGVPLHTDATATAGSLSLPADSEGPDLITLSPHLFHGPQGVGALRVRRGVRLAPLIEGGGQEAGLRAGTEPLAAIVGFGAAATLVCREGARRARSAAALAEHMHRWIDTHLDGVVWTGHPVHRVPGLLTLCVRGVEAEAVLNGLDAEGIEAASGSACTTEVRKASHVLQAIGVDPVTARGALTFAFGELNVPGDADTSAQTLESVVRRLRALSPIDAR